MFWIFTEAWDLFVHALAHWQNTFLSKFSLYFRWRCLQAYWWVMVFTTVTKLKSQTLWICFIDPWISPIILWEPLLEIVDLICSVSGKIRIESYMSLRNKQKLLYTFKSRPWNESVLRGLVEFSWFYTERV